MYFLNTKSLLGYCISENFGQSLTFLKRVTANRVKSINVVL